jgi:hypothetical protein
MTYENLTVLISLIFVILITFINIYEKYDKNRYFELFPSGKHFNGSNVIITIQYCISICFIIVELIIFS